MPDFPLIKSYQGALDTAIKIASRNNLPPIDGTTVVFVDVSNAMKCPCNSTKGQLGTTIQDSLDVAILLGLMIQDSCDDVDFRIFSSPINNGERSDISIPLEENTILNNVKRVQSYVGKLNGHTSIFPIQYFNELIEQKKKLIMSSSFPT